MAMFVGRAQMSSRCWCQSEVSGGWRHLLRALGSGSEPRNFVGKASSSVLSPSPAWWLL